MILTTQQSKILAVAEAQLGKEYVYGGKGPDTFDCSGLTSWVYLYGADIVLGEGTVGQLLDGLAVVYTGTWSTWAYVKSLLQPMDLIFPLTDHVQLWTGDDIIEAPHAGLNVHRIPQWASTIYAVRRILPSNASQPPAGVLPWQGVDLAVQHPWIFQHGTGEWQDKMNKVLGLDLEVDSYYGPATAAATYRFQASKGLQRDSVVGSITWAAAFG
jgi:hypothetical protein